MKKVLLISPPVRNQREVSLIPSGLLSIGGFLRKHGFEVKVYDSCFPNKTSYQEKIKKTNEMIKEYAPDFLGLGFPTEAFESAIGIAKQAKDLDKNIVIVVGGIHPTAKPEETLKTPYFDFLVHSEGEITTKELLDAIIHKKEIINVKGISYKRDDRIITNDSRLEILNLDEIPFDNRDLLIDVHKYSKEALGQIHTSRGCPYKCAYCSSSIIWGKKVRFRSKANVIKEIDYLYHQYHVKDINFADDNFLLEPERVRVICEELIKRKHKIHWRCCARADIHRHFDTGLLRLMHKAGCRQICIGFESGAQNLLDKVDREVKMNDMETVLKIMKDARIGLHADFIIGLPGENEESLQETFRLMQRVWKICQPTMTVALFKPYPGITAYGEKDTIDYPQLYPEFKKLFAYAETRNIKKLSENPVYVYNKFIKNINSPKQIWSLFKKGIRAWI